MNILIAGSPNSTEKYRSWIEEEFSADVKLIDDLGILVSTLSNKDWKLLIVDNEYGEIRIEEFVRSIKVVRPTIPIVALCSDRPNEAIEIMRLGITDYLVKPVTRERLLKSVGEVLGNSSGEMSAAEPQETDAQIEVLSHQDPPPDNIIFEGSSKMSAVGQVVEKILDVDLPVLITGESGTGKEILAKYIYGKSNRKGPFIKVNCAAIPSELLESELFGYERGAFTGAYRRKPGKFEAADGGILFLDEISELSYPLQSKLLHVLQDGTISTIGSTREVRVDVRVIVATNQDLEDCVKRGTFRDDLFFRLNVVHINVPPLRERLKQLDVLIDYFREKFAHQYNTNPVHLDDDAKSFLFSYRWPGNIRELENTIRRATVLGGENLLGNINGLDEVETGQAQAVKDSAGSDYEMASFPESPNDHVNSTPDQLVNGENSLLPEALNLKEIAKEAALVAEREAIARVLHQTRWNRKKTAQILHVSYKTLLSKIKETGLDEN